MSRAAPAGDSRQPTAQHEPWRGLERLAVPAGWIAALAACLPAVLGAADPGERAAAILALAVVMAWWIAVVVTIRSDLRHYVIAAIGASWADLSAAGAEREAKSELLERSIAAGRRAALEPGTKPLSDPFVTAQTATLAAAQVDADLRALAIASGLTLRSSRTDAKPDDPGTVGGSNGIGIRIEDQAIAEGQNEALQAFLVKLEADAPVVLIDALAIELAEIDQAALADPQEPRLRVSLTISAYWRASSKTNSPP